MGRQGMKSIWLELIVETAACGSISEAAEKCHISQPAASRMIMNAENELSTQIFNRSTKLSGLQLTDRGKELLPYIEDAVNALKRLEEKAGAPTVPVLRIGMSEDTWGANARSRILSGFYLAQPGVTLKIELFKNDRLINALIQDKVDVIIFSWGNMLNEQPPKPFETLPVTVRMLGDRPISVAYGAEHAPKGAKNGYVKLQSLKDESFIIHMDIKQREKQKLQRFYFLESCRMAGFDPQIKVVPNASNVKQRMAINGEGVFLSSAPEELREFPGVDFAIILDCPYVARYFLVYRTLGYNKNIDILHQFLLTFFNGQAGREEDQYNG